MFSYRCADPDCHANGCRLMRKYMQPFNYPLWTTGSQPQPLTEDDIRRIVREELERKEQK